MDLWRDLWREKERDKRKDKEANVVKARSGFLVSCRSPFPLWIQRQIHKSKVVHTLSIFFPADDSRLKFRVWFYWYHRQRDHRNKVGWWLVQQFSSSCASSCWSSLFSRPYYFDMHTHFPTNFDIKFLLWRFPSTFTRWDTLHFSSLLEYHRI